MITLVVVPWPAARKKLAGAMSIEKSAKRRRAGELGLLASTPPPPEAFRPPPPAAAATPVLTEQGDAEPAGKPDVFEYFAQRANKQRELEMEVQRLKQREAQLASKLEEAELAASRQRDAGSSGAARQQAREAQLELQLKEQQEALRLEVEHSAGLSQQLRAAAAAAEAAELRAAAALEAAAADAAGQQAGAAAAGPAATELRLQVSQLQMQLEQLQADREEGERRAQGALRTAHQRCEAEAATARLLQQQLEEAVAIAERCSGEKHALEAELAGLDRQLVHAQTQLEAAKSSGGGDPVLVKALRDQLREQEALVVEARRLKEQAT
jgi:DNA repair exonuclease SbcCD ATPase subunit